jgi:hypothetical protein
LSLTLARLAWILTFQTCILVRIFIEPLGAIHAILKRLAILAVLFAGSTYVPLNRVNLVKSEFALLTFLPIYRVVIANSAILCAPLTNSLFQNGVFRTNLADCLICTRSTILRASYTSVILNKISMIAFFA